MRKLWWYTQKYNVLLISFAVVVSALVIVGRSSSPVSADTTDNLVCTPSSTNHDYTLPNVDKLRLAETSEVGTSWAGMPAKQAIVTEGSDQYVAYYNADKRLTVAHRKTDSSSWQTYSIPGDDAVVGWDSHNNIGIGVDKNGDVHVAGNMHQNALRYWRTTKSGDITSFERIPTMANATLESSVTYPTFMKNRDGDFLFTYRNGSSGSGNTYINIYNETTKTWSALLSTPLFDGSAVAEGNPDHSAYYTLTDNGTYYEVVWVWRQTNDISTNRRLSYMRSRDLVHWETVNGTALSLPIKFDTAGVVVDDIPKESGLFLRNWVGTDADGRTTVTYSKFDVNDSNQIYIARANADGSWTSTQVTHWTGQLNLFGTGTINNSVVSLSATSPLPGGKVQISFSCDGINKASGTIVLDNDTLQPIAQVEKQESPYPSAIYKRDATTPSTNVNTTMETVSSSLTYVLKWQAQTNNNDQPYDTWPEAQPIKVYKLTPYSKATVPKNVTATINSTRTEVILQWEAPDDDGGYPITNYIIEISSDGGSTWSSYDRGESTATTASITGLSPAKTYTFRVSAVTSLGAGSWATTYQQEDSPSTTHPQAASAPNTSLHRLSVNLFMACLAVVASFILLCMTLLMRRASTSQAIASSHKSR